MVQLLRNARLADGSIVDVVVTSGRVESVQPVGRGESEAPLAGDAEVDLQGWLLLPALAEPHAHLDKALTAEVVPNPAGDLAGAIAAWTAAAQAGTFSHESTVERAARAMELLLVHGVTIVRTHVNVLDGVGAANVVAVREAASRFQGMLDVQIVALTGNPMTGPEGAGTRRALDEAVEAGVDLIGGCPHLDPDGPGLIAHALKVASDAGLSIDLHVDETLDPSVLTLRSLARQVMDTGFAGSVAASHCVSLGLQTPRTQAAVAAEVAEAGISIFALPQTNLFLQGRDHPTATPRGLTAVAALVDAGVTVGAGGDNVQDPFNLVGRSDPLETASLMVMAAHRLPDEAYDMVSANVALALGAGPMGIEPGAPADFLAIDAPSIRAAIADAPMSRRVFKAGVLVAETHQSSRLYKPGAQR